MMSSTVIPAPPSLLLVDASRNTAGWESELCDRMLATMARRNMSLVEQAAVRVSTAEGLGAHASTLQSASCIVLIGHGANGAPYPNADVRRYWQWLTANVTGPKLVAVCTWLSYDPELTNDILKTPHDLAPLAVAQQSVVAPREGALFLLKFFAELRLHSESSTMTGRMAWFSWTKAKELLKRRRLEAAFGLRA